MDERKNVQSQGARAMLELNASQAVLLLDEVSHSRLCQPVLRSLSYYTDFFDFSILRKKL